MNKKKLINHSFIFLLLSILFCQCYEPTEKCLDPLATNYDVTGDVPCDDCCTDPQLKINLRLRYNEANVTKDSWIEYAPGDTVSIESLEMALSSFIMLDAALDTIRSLKTFDYENITYYKDLNFINSASVTIDAFSFKYIGQIKGISFALGIPQTLQKPNANFDIPLLDQIQDSLWNIDDSNMATIKFRYILKDSVEQEDLQIIDLNDDLLPFNVDTLTLKATDLNYVLNFNLNKWWRNIDFKRDDPADIQSKLSDNLLGSFELE